MNEREKGRLVWEAITTKDKDQVISLIQQNPDLLEARLPGNLTPLVWCAYRGGNALAECFIQMGAKVDILAAVVLGRTEEVRTMLGDQPSLIRKHSPWGGISLLHVATEFGDLDMLRLMVSCGLDPNECCNPRHLTPLFFAGSPPFAKAELLLALGADINFRAKHGFTVLHKAASWGQEAWVGFLLSHGADTEAQTAARQTPWELAVKYKHHRIAATLASASRDRHRYG